MRSAGINPVDARIRSGSFGGRPPLVFGTEFAGIVVESRDHTIQKGAEVIGWGVQGSNGDLVVSEASRLAHKPEALDWHIAAGIGGVCNTAMTALAALRLQAGDTIVVHGAAGGVGHDPLAARLRPTSQHHRDSIREESRAPARTGRNAGGIR